MMAEVVVVSAIVVVTLTVLFMSYNKVYMAYKTRISYYDTVILYRLAYYRDILIKNNKMNEVLATAKENKVMTIYDSNNSTDNVFVLPENDILDTVDDKVLIIYNNKNNLDVSNLNLNNNINSTFIDYLNYLSTGVDLTEMNYVMVMERCNKSNSNDCKYTYLEIYDDE